jgi:UDP-N-acetyl-D-glucosamine dehydrogenase
MTDREASSHADALARRLSGQEAVVGVIGLGYVGLPLAAASAGGGFRTVGFDIDPLKIEALNQGRSYIDAVAPQVVAGYVGAGRFRASGDFSETAQCDVIAICVPTPLSRHREPICASSSPRQRRSRRA